MQYPVGTIAKNMKMYREKKKLTQMEAAERMAITGSYYNRIEKGKCPPTYTMISGIYYVCQWDIDYILTGKQHAKNPFWQLYEECEDGNEEELSKLIIWTLTHCVRKLEHIHWEKQRKYVNTLAMCDCFADAYWRMIPEAKILQKIRCVWLISEDVMAEKLHVSEEVYRKLERGEIKPKPEIFVMVNEAFGINPSFLMTGKLGELNMLREIWYCLPKEARDAAYAFIQAGMKI